MEPYSIGDMDPLLWAASDGDTTEVNRLLKKGANVKAKNKWGSTALIVAASGGYTETVRALLSAGADPNVRNYKGRTPMIEAALGNHSDVIQLLVSAGGGVNQKARDGRSSFDIGFARRAAWVLPFLTKPKRFRREQSM